MNKKLFRIKPFISRTSPCFVATLPNTHEGNVVYEQLKNSTKQSLVKIYRGGIYSPQCLGGVNGWSRKQNATRFDVYFK